MSFPTSRLGLALAPAVGVALAFLGAGCTPEIGDSCKISTDCSIRGDRLCDISQPGGYCTQLNCRGQSCADEAACVLFYSAVPGCSYDDRAGPFGSRVARSFCMKWCESNSDCRDGYVCADPRSFPWNAVVLDNNQGKRTCLAVPLEGQDGGLAASVQPPPVCSPAAPPASPIDAGPARIYDSGPVAPPLFSADAGTTGTASDGG